MPSKDIVRERLEALRQEGPTTPVGAVDAPAGSQLEKLMGSMKQKQKSRKRKMQRRRWAAKYRQATAGGGYQEVLRSLLGKAKMGYLGGQVKEGHLPFAAIPADIRKQTKYPYPAVSFDPEKLTPEEHKLYLQLQSRSEANTRKRAETRELEKGQ